MNTIIECPKCKCQLEVKLTFASGPKSSNGAKPGAIGELLEQAEAQSLNDWEHEFITKLRERYDQYHERTKLSEKQLAILERIASGEKREEPF